MKMSNMFVQTMREFPSDAEVVSHKMLARAGYIKKLTSGVYTFLPLMWRVLKKVENIIRDEMDKAGAQELLMPFVQPKELWEESGRWNAYGGELMRLKDRHGRDMCLGPTHEEIITSVARDVLKSYKQLPVNLYQIQSKFRDERRPRFGLLRGREFIMKDAYSFSTSQEDLEREYQNMWQAYTNIFKRCGLDTKAVQSDSGAIGGSVSHEFMVITDTDAGENDVFYCECDYSANSNHAVSNLPDAVTDGGFGGVKKYGEYEVKIVADKTVKDLKNFVVGINQTDKHLVGANWGVDLDLPEIVEDIRLVEAGDFCPECRKPLKVTRGIEVGNIFQLGTKYSAPMNAVYLDANGKTQPYIMGCYGIGVTRTAAAAVEAHHDDWGIKWPLAIAPYHVVVVPVSTQDEGQMKAANEIYTQLLALGVETVLDDRNERPGVKFKDADLIGFPYRITVGKTITEGKVEFVERSNGEKLVIPVQDAIDRVVKAVSEIK